MTDAIQKQKVRNLAKAKPFRELLEKTLQRCPVRSIDAAVVIAEVVTKKKEMDESEKRTKLLALSDEVVVDASAENAGSGNDEPLLHDRAHQREARHQEEFQDELDRAALRRSTSRDPRSGQVSVPQS